MLVCRFARLAESDSVSRVGYGGICFTCQTPHTSGTKSASRALRAHLTPEIAPPVAVSGEGPSW